MDRKSHSQLELFSPPKGYSELKTQDNYNAFLSYIRNYEKVILIIIGFIVTGIISFSLGVEKGKTIVRSPASIQTMDKSPLQPPPSIEKRDDVKQPQPKEEKIQNYTIQLASYKTKAHAEQEAERLRKKGISPLVLSKGAYTVLYAGSFPDKETAKSLLPELKKRYHDCFIKRL